MAKKTVTTSMLQAQEILQQRLRDRLRRLEPGSPKIREALFRAATLIENATKANILKKDITDQGGLLNSIRHEFVTRGTRTSVEVGSFGIPYAAINEFGGIQTAVMRRAMFAAFRERDPKGTRAFVNKGIIKNGVWKPRPYLSPAFNENKDAVLKELRKVVDDG